MICVFFRFPLTGVQGVASPVESRAATAAGEIANTVEWIAIYS